FQRNSMGDQGRTPAILDHPERAEHSGLCGPVSPQFAHSSRFAGRLSARSLGGEIAMLRPS
ncbi:hypothetical protein, partial [Roseiarcus sp.]|uniref:hypothetical protein n=1 Tax=Roseiarcus sp. TaxID=1969460 RepID=UPI003F978ACB